MARAGAGRRGRVTEGPKPFVFDDNGEQKRFAPATLRNRDAIIDVLRQELPEQGSIVEIASGTGEHIVHFAKLFPQNEWQPTDRDPAALASIDAWQAESRLGNVKPALELDAITENWPVADADAILCINMVHISPWEATAGLMHGAGRILPPKGLLYLYGPYRETGKDLAESNASFDLSLKSRSPDWGLRLLEDVAALAEKNGLALEKRIEMPANNLSLVFRRQ